MLTLTCDRCKTEMATSGEAFLARIPGSRFGFPTYDEHSGSLVLVREISLCRACAVELVGTLLKWFPEMLKDVEQWQKDHPSGKPLRGAS